MTKEYKIKLRPLLEQVPGAYDDFVRGTIAFLKTDEAAEKMIEFLEAGGGTDTDAVCWRTIELNPVLMERHRAIERAREEKARLRNRQNQTRQLAGAATL